jgi:hypothetical protein
VNISDRDLGYPMCAGEVFKGIPTPFDRAMYAKGTTICWSAWSSCTKRWSDALNAAGDGVVFLIKTHSGRELSVLGAATLDEVLLPPTARFVVTDWYIGDVIALGQANIRTSAFRVTEASLARATKAGQCVIVELTEAPDA